MSKIVKKSVLMQPISKAFDVPDGAEHEAVSQQSEASEVLDVVNGIELTDAQQYEAAVTIVAEIKAQAAKVDGTRRSFVDPLNQVVNRINTFFRPVLTAYAEAERVLKAKLVDYQQRQQAERDRLLIEAGRGGARAGELIQTAEASVVPKVEGMSTRTEWVGEVVDRDAIPREYMIPDVNTLAAMTKALKGDPKIPGWKAYPKQIVAIKKGAGR